MKKLLAILILISMVGCVKDHEFIGPELNSIDVPKSLEIVGTTGIKLESTIVTSEVRMNVKLPYNGNYRIKIRDISNELISQEMIEGKEGDNLLKVYTSTLPSSSYTLLLCDYNHEVLGITTIVVK